MKKNKLVAKLQFSVAIPQGLRDLLTPDNRDWLKDLSLAILRGEGDQPDTYIFKLEDIFKVRYLFQGYETFIAFPPSAQIRRYGLKHSSGDTLDIKAQGDAFICTQFMPDGKVETHIVPKDVLWRVFYRLRDYFATNPPVKTLHSSAVWEMICKEFGLDRYFDRFGRFHKNSFFGDRKQYFYFAYYPLKVLDHIHKIIYSGPYISMPIKKESTDAPEKTDQENEEEARE